MRIGILGIMGRSSRHPASIGRRRRFVSDPDDVTLYLNRLFLRLGGVCLLVGGLLLGVSGLVHATPLLIGLSVATAGIGAVAVGVAWMARPPIQLLLVVGFASAIGIAEVSGNALLMAVTLVVVVITSTAVMLDRRILWLGAAGVFSVTGLLLSRQDEPLDTRILAFAIVVVGVASMWGVLVTIRVRHTRVPRLLQALLEHTGEGIILVDSAERILVFAGTAPQMFGYRPDEVLGKPLNLLIPAAASGVHHAHVANFAQGEATLRLMGERLSVHGRHSTGKDIPIGVSISKVPVDGEIYLAAVVRDLSERAAAADSMWQLAESRLNLIASVSHELRTPLTAVVGYAELLLSKESGLSEREREDALLTISREAVDAVAVLNDLLVASRLELGNLPVAGMSVDLAAQVRQVVEGFSAITNQPIEVIAGTGLLVTGDPARIRQVIRNLVANALKHGGPTISVSVEKSGTEGVIYVTDSGSGPSPDIVHVMFDAFHSGQIPEGRTGSFGLGLSISRKLARAMGGDVRYARIGESTRFSLHLPLAD
ncbi:MAG TPA: hypothetical protein DCY40_09760 [Actinobacteria bacterium]|nr:hypothetical protein [Actinomycetota bacterium]